VTVSRSKLAARRGRVRTSARTGKYLLAHRLKRGCDQHLNPLPWLIVGITLTLAGLIAQTLHNRMSGHADLR
jgi:hypothetical protein